MRRVLFCSCLSLALASQGLRGQQVKGAASLQGPGVVASGYLKATPVAGKPLTEKLDFWMTPPDSTAAYTSYQVEMTKKLHVIIVSKNFKTFLHIHPRPLPNGHFEIVQSFPAPGTYEVYSDGLPGKLPQHQVFRFEIKVGQGGSDSMPVLAPTGQGVQIGPYEVDLSTVRLHSGRMEMIDIVVQENGKPATDLHPYLGAPAHAVFLNTKDMSYVHAHPMAPDTMMDMSKPMPELPDSAKLGSEMMLHVALYEPGTYRLWLQFRGKNDQLYVAEFTLIAD